MLKKNTVILIILIIVVIAANVYIAINSNSIAKYKKYINMSEYNKNSIILSAVNKYYKYIEEGKYDEAYKCTGISMGKDEYIKLYNGDLNRTYSASMIGIEKESEYVFKCKVQVALIVIDDTYETTPIDIRIKYDFERNAFIVLDDGYLAYLGDRNE